MFIDILQAYADAMYVATMQRPAPTPARQSQCRAVREEVLHAAPAPVSRRRIGRWIAMRLRRQDIAVAEPTAVPAKLALPKI